MSHHAKPFVKWAGGKSQLLVEIRKKYPAAIRKYAEPFVGGGAVLFDVLNTYDLDEVYIGDINQELINAYTIIRDDVSALIEILYDFQRQYHSASGDQRKTIYYQKRDEFNDFSGDSISMAALFIFLNKTCFNGLYRVNLKGRFNVPQGDYKNPMICDEQNLRSVSEKLQNVNIVHGDYKTAMGFIDDKTFAYFDPPYRPLSPTSNFTSYTQNSFDDIDQMELARFIDEVSQRGTYVVASNSDPRSVNEND